MTKRLEELFDLTSATENELVASLPDLSQGNNEITMSTLEKIEIALPGVRGLEASDEEMDELAKLATDSYRDLMDMGHQVEPRFSSEIFNSASSMLGHAITARTAKINKKLKILELQLKKVQLEHKIQSQPSDLDATPLGQGQSLDRNDLLKMFKDKNNNQ